METVEKLRQIFAVALSSRGKFDLQIVKMFKTFYCLEECHKCKKWEMDKILRYLLEPNKEQPFWKYQVIYTTFPEARGKKYLKNDQNYVFFFESPPPPPPRNLSLEECHHFQKPFMATNLTHLFWTYFGACFRMIQVVWTTSVEVKGWKVPKNGPKYTTNNCTDTLTPWESWKTFS